MSLCHPHGKLTFSGLVTGRSRPIGAFPFSAASKPDDPIGVTNVTFDGIPADCEILVQLSDGTQVAAVENCIVNQILTWTVYSAGSPNNLVTIKVVDIRYRLKVFTYTSRVGDQSIPIQMEEDVWYKNPL